MESCHTDWRGAVGEVADVPAEVEVKSVYVPEMDDAALLFEKNAGWTQDVHPVDLRLVDIWGQYRDELSALKLSVPGTPLEVAKIGRELLSSDIVFET